jgi:hypothetical protein
MQAVGSNTGLVVLEAAAMGVIASDIKVFQISAKVTAPVGLRV